MKHFLLLPLLATALVLTWSIPALAGSKVEGNGYKIRVPSDFDDAFEITNSGTMKIKSRFSHLPVEGVPEVRAWMVGSQPNPSATLMVSRVDMSRSVTTLDHLGIRQMSRLQDQMGEGFEYRPTKVNGYNAIEMTMAVDVAGDQHNVRILSIACGEFVIVVMLDTVDDRYRGAEVAWHSAVGSIEIVPDTDRLVLYGLIALAAVAGLGLMFKLARYFRESGHRGQADTYARRSSSISQLDPGPTFAEGGSGPGRAPGSGSMDRPPRAAAPSRSGLTNPLHDEKTWKKK